MATTGSTTFNSLLFRPEDYVAGVQYVAAVVYATNPDLSRFAAKGGKLILRSNSADYVANPRVITDYYESVVRTMGQKRVDEFMRYYVTTGPGHARFIGRNTVTNAVAPYYVDVIAMLDNWSEDGMVPPRDPVVTLQNSVPPFEVQ